MAITSLDGYIAAAKQRVVHVRQAARTSTANTHFSVFDLAGNPGAGTLAVGNTANGVVPTDATAGYPLINAFGGSNKGYLSGVEFANTVACRMVLFDCLFSAGAYSFNSNVTLASQPSYSSRIPGGTDYNGLELWLEAVTAFTGNLSVAVTYTNQSGTTGRTTGTIALGLAPTVGRMTYLPLQAGDSGIQTIESVVATVATVGTFNLHVMRRLWSGRIGAVNSGDKHDMLRTGMPEVYADSALRVTVNADSTSTGFPDFEFEIANG